MAECSDNTIYTGITNDIDKRLAAHNNGSGAKYTKTRRPVKLLIVFNMLSKSSASKLEYKIKQLTRHQKLKLINILANAVPTKSPLPA